MDGRQQDENGEDNGHGPTDVNDDSVRMRSSLHEHKHSEHPEETDHQEKKVKVSDSPEVFNIVPGSTEVKHQDSPPPPPPTNQPSQKQPAQDLEKIITDTVALVEVGQKQALQLKLDNQKMAFMLTLILEDLRRYEQFAEKLHNFLVQNERLQNDWYHHFCEILPTYGDYAEVLRDSPDAIVVDDVPFPVTEKSLKKLVQDVGNNFYAAGSHVRLLKTVCRDICSTVDRRRKLVREMTGPFSSWFFLMNRSAENQQVIADQLFKVSAFLGFLNTGELQQSEKLDLDKSKR